MLAEPCLAYINPCSLLHHMVHPNTGMCLCHCHMLLLRAFQVNFIDTYHRSGLYPRSTFPAGLGEEGAGTVVEVGPGELVTATTVHYVITCSSYTRIHLRPLLLCC